MISSRPFRNLDAHDSLSLLKSSSFQSPAAKRIVVLSQGLGRLSRTMPEHNRILLQRRKQWWLVVLGYTGAAGQPKVGKVLNIGPAKANFLRPGA